MAGIAYLITGHERTQLNRVCYFISLMWSLLLLTGVGEAGDEGKYREKWEVL